MIDGLLRDIIEHVMRRAMFYGLYRYRVISQSHAFELGSGAKGGDLVTLQVASERKGLPPLVSLPKGHGVAGVTEQLAPSTLVLVAFEGGDPGAPILVHVLPGQASPETITADARDTITLGGTSSGPAAVAGVADDNFGILLAAVNVLNGLATPPKPALPTLPSVAASKVNIE